MGLSSNYYLADDLQGLIIHPRFCPPLILSVSLLAKTLIFDHFRINESQNIVCLEVS